MNPEIYSWFLGLRCQTTSTRRAFLVSCAGLPILAIGHLCKDLFSRELITQQNKNQTAEPGPGEQRLLQVVTDEMIPCCDGMSSASESGALSYLRLLALQDPQIEAQLKKSLATLRSLCAKGYAVDFPNLPQSQRVQVLSEMEKGRVGQDFETLKNYVYEAYYTQPRILGLIACQANTTVIGDDSSLLAPVRAMNGLYRQVH